MIGGLWFVISNLLISVCCLLFVFSCLLFVCLFVGCLSACLLSVVYC